MMRSLVRLPRAFCAAALAIFVAAPRLATADELDLVLKAEAARTAVVDKVEPTVVAIFAAGGQGGGSGVLISADGYALSNYHVTRPCGVGMKCGLADGKLYDAVIVGVDMTGDVALIKLLGREDFPYARLGDSDEVQVGDWCFAMGNPFLLATDFKPTVTYGIVSGTQRYQYPAGTLLEYTDCLQIDASINPGNSGGPLFDSRGDLIGINGRGSFEKRGRVNVGVGYAISINQIKNFMGCLKAGRLVDHATLGALVSTSDEGQVVVQNILETSDAYRRGLRYEDEIVSFAGRPIRTVNAFKNVLGIFPRDWRVPLVYRRQGERFTTSVRLLGVHRSGELEKLDGGGDAEKKGRQPKPKPDEMKMIEKKAELADVVKKHYEARTGFANYHFNKVNQERIWKLAARMGDYSAAQGTWTLSGVTDQGQPLKLQLSDKVVALNLPAGETTLSIGDDLSKERDPIGSGGLASAAFFWRTFLAKGAKGFNDVTYFGELPMPGRDGLVDALVVQHAKVECRFLVDPSSGQLLALELFTDNESDPCEIFFSEYAEVEGRLLPKRIEVRSGDAIFGTFSIAEFKLK